MTRRTYEWVTDIHAGLARKALRGAGWEVLGNVVGALVRRRGDAYIATSDTGLVMVAENVGAITFGPDGEVPADE